MGVWGRVLFGCAAIVLACEAISANAQPLEPAGEWGYQQSTEACRATRTFGHDADRVILQLRTFGPNSPVEVTVARADLPKEPWSARRTEVGWDGDELGRDQFAVLASIGGLPSATLLMGYRRTSIFKKGQVDETIYVATPLELGARTLQVRVAGASPINLEVGPLSEPVARLAECENALLDQWGWGAGYLQRLSSDPEIVGPTNVGPTIVYPAPMVVNRISTFIQLRLKVDAAGKVAECIVQSSPANRRFGEDSCRTIRRKIRYTPARDQQGAPVESYAQMGIGFLVIY